MVNLEILRSLIRHTLAITAIIENRTLYFYSVKKLFFSSSTFLEHIVNNRYCMQRKKIQFG